MARRWVLLDPSQVTDCPERVRIPTLESTDLKVEDFKSLRTRQVRGRPRKRRCAARPERGRGEPLVRHLSQGRRQNQASSYVLTQRPY